MRVFVAKDSKSIGVEPIPVPRDEGEAVVIMSRIVALSLGIVTVDARWKREDGRLGGRGRD